MLKTFDHKRLLPVFEKQTLFDSAQSCGVAQQIFAELSIAVCNRFPLVLLSPALASIVKSSSFMSSFPENLNRQYRCPDRRHLGFFDLHNDAREDTNNQEHTLENRQLVFPRNRRI